MNNEQIKEIFEKIDKEATKKEFSINNIEEWYFVSGLWLQHIFTNMKATQQVRNGKRQEVIRIASRKDPEKFLHYLFDLFKTEYTKIDISQKYDGIFSAIVNYKEENESNYDGSIALSQGLTINY